ncbi:hypothetical protein L3Q82_019336 [Scortum barcoo]|uniref:Uncharacterized protein n=1 Tax=Scortum barcoo TaxID=214431 RepID=A0ACB8VBA2_9TELE|nr:hypothetical protein L3Q82_019336 [Scortum barcoo]
MAVRRPTPSCGQARSLVPVVAVLGNPEPVQVVDTGRLKKESPGIWRTMEVGGTVGLLTQLVEGAALFQVGPSNSQRQYLLGQAPSKTIAAGVAQRGGLGSGPVFREPPLCGLEKAGGRIQEENSGLVGGVESRLCPFGGQEPFAMFSEGMKGVEWTRLWQLMPLCLAWSPLCQPSRVHFIGTPQECKKAQYVPGYNLGGEGFDIVTMERKGAYVIDTETWDLGNGTCRLYRNSYMNNVTTRKSQLPWWTGEPSPSAA